ncbi:MAG: hypothetical protein AAFU67_12510 [Bacteroidota bacterium]
MANEQDNSPSIPTPGMQMVQNAVEFTDTHVLQPDVKPIQGTSKTMADQAAAMLIQDMRSFMQGSEQIITVGMAKSIALMLDPATEQIGNNGLQQLENLLTKLPEFAAKMGSTATKIANEFGKSS